MDPIHQGPVVVLHGEDEVLEPHSGDASHTEHGLTYVESGCVRMVHGVPLEATAGSLILVPAGAPHRLLGGEVLRYWLVGFCATCLTLDEEQPLMEPFRRVRAGAVPVLTVAAARRPRVQVLYRELAEELRRDVPEILELVRSLVLLLLGEARRAMPGSDGGGGASLASQALTVIQRRCLEPISLRDVARAVHRTPTHVARVVKKETGHSVGAWIAAGRVAEAASRLTHTDDSLEAIAEHVGWSDKTHFIRQFRKAYGMTPAAWRRARRATPS